MADVYPGMPGPAIPFQRITWGCGAQEVDLADVYLGVPGCHPFRLRSMVCFYGAHYHAFVLSDASTPEALLEQLAEELLLLRDTPAERIDTTLIVHPDVLQDFLDYNDFLDNADAAVEALDLEGVLQVASFHPAYQFAGTAFDDIGNYTNRSPYPTLHLLREDSVSRAVDAFPDADAIVDRNVETLDKLGLQGWNKLFGTDTTP